MFMTRSFNVTPKTTEQHLIAHSDKSVAYVTKNKRLCSTSCTIEVNYWQTRSIARPLCDSRATCICVKHERHSGVTRMRENIGRGSAPDPAVSLQRSPDPLAGVEGPPCPSPRTSAPPPVLGPLGHAASVRAWPWQYVFRTLYSLPPHVTIRGLRDRYNQWHVNTAESIGILLQVYRNYLWSFQLLYETIAD